MIYGYARVTTDAQELSNQLAELKAAGCDPIFQEKITGAHAERPQLKRQLAKCSLATWGWRQLLTASRATRLTYRLSPASWKRRPRASARLPSL